MTGTRSLLDSFRARVFRLGGGAALALLVAGCGGDSWFGESSFEPHPGERQGVLIQERGLATAPHSNRPVVLPDPEPNEDWPQSGGYSHHAMQHMVADGPLTELWTTRIGSGSTKRGKLLNSPIVAEGLVFTIDRRASVRAFDARTGRKVWDVSLPERGTEERDGDFLGGGIAYEDGRIFATTGFAKVVALDAASGTELWRASMDAPVRAAPTVNSGRVVVVTLGNQTVALAAADGSKLWVHSGVAESTSLMGTPAPAIDQGIVVVAYSSGEVFALRLESGTEIWADSVTAVRRTDAAGLLYDIRANPIIDGNRVYFIGNSGLMVGMDLRSGGRAWQLRVAGTQSPWIAGDVLYLVSEDAELAAVSASSGEVLWSFSLPRWNKASKQKGALFWIGPILVSDRLIVGCSDGYVYSFSPYTGKLLGQIELSSAMVTTPVVADGILYFLTEKGRLVAFH
ncbi:PQQ-binding-like beta-propeller repeat protein [Phaeovibrio sulfidiphilus]|uniref:PQQ-binding-like beta-propeller repeat protein n=2 Tax=Phaeovibrio sulfidiphilus TaxID=1220600 RepID=A0A8J6YLK6_9PROT|nr:PQQ-binding-like beta-propeller repeat protein [Phaeovibrio sulfidiphilus]